MLKDSVSEAARGGSQIFVRGTVSTNFHLTSKVRTRWERDKLKLSSESIRKTKTGVNANSFVLFV